MRRTERLGRAYIRYKTTPFFVLLWVVFGAFIWAVLLYAGASFGPLVSKSLGL